METLICSSEQEAIMFMQEEERLSTGCIKMMGKETFQLMQPLFHPTV